MDLIDVAEAMWLLLGGICTLLGAYLLWLSVCDWRAVRSASEAASLVRIVAWSRVRWAGTHTIIGAIWTLIGARRAVEPLPDLPDAYGWALAIRLIVVLGLLVKLGSLLLDLGDRQRLYAATGKED